MRKTLRRRCLSDEPGGACCAGVIFRRYTGAGDSTCMVTIGAAKLSPRLAELDCHSDNGEGGASCLPMQWEQNWSCCSGTIV